MEDRQPPRLHVELVRSPDTIAARAEAVAAAGWRVSTWAQCEHQDERLRLRLAPCLGLVIGEGEGAPVAPPSDATTVVPLPPFTDQQATSTAFPFPPAHGGPLAQLGEAAERTLCHLMLFCKGVTASTGARA